MNKVIYEKKDFPILQNRVYESYEDALDCVRGDIRIVEDQESGLIYNEKFRPELMVYDSNYNNEQGVSILFQKHLESVTEIIGKNLGRESLVEVGCGKGFFFEMLRDKGFELFGFDPSYEGNNPNIAKEYFRTGVMKPSKGIILRHVLEHVPEPFDFLSQLRDANGGGGLIYIEVPCFDWICKRRVWFDIYYEHVNYFRMIDFERMFGRIVSSGRSFGEQYLYIVGDLSTLSKPKFKKETSIQFPFDFLNGISSTNVGALVWGGASKGVIFSLLMQRAGKSIEGVIDLNQAKQGKFLPVTGLQIMNPQEALDNYPKNTPVYCMNSNYLNEIKEISKDRFRYILVD